MQPEALSIPILEKVGQLFETHAVGPSKQSIGTWNQSSFTNEGEDLPIIQFRVAELLLKREKEGNSSSRDQIDVLDENPFYIDNNLQQVLK